jgi:hypothetical protein
MYSPRGIHCTLFFSGNGRYLGSISDADPLWCEGSKLYLSEDVSYRDTGNVVELEDGFRQTRLHHEDVVGSPLLQDEASTDEREVLKKALSKVPKWKSTGASFPNTRQEGSLDEREKMLLEAKAHQTDFPNGRSHKLIGFAYVAKLKTRGGLIYACDQRVMDSAAPLGPSRNTVVFFDDRFHYLGAVDYGTNFPLWASGAKLFLWGDSGHGNVIDLSSGFPKKRQYHETAYGSTGGIKDK